MTQVLDVVKAGVLTGSSAADQGARVTRVPQFSSSVLKMT